VNGKKYYIKNGINKIYNSIIKIIETPLEMEEFFEKTPQEDYPIYS